MASEHVLSATDADGDTLTYSASSDTTAVIATVSNDMLTLTPANNWNGVANITVYVSDGSLSDTTAFMLTVSPVNDAPVVSAPVPDVSIDEDDFGAVIITALEAHFNDVDLDDILSFSANALGAGLDSLSLNDDGMANSGRFVDYGSAKIMTIKRSVKKSSQGKSFSFGESDDKSALMDIVSIINPGREGRSSSRTDSTSLIVYPTEDFFGNVDIVITATDTSGEMASDTLNLSIENLNDAPSLATLADASTDEEMASEHVLSATDADGDTLTYSASSDTTAVTATVSNDTLTLTPEVNWNGIADITVIVSDGLLTDTAAFVLTVNAVNDAPFVFQSMADITVDEDADTLLLAIDGVFDDEDIINGDSLSITAVSLNTDLITVGSDANAVPFLLFTANGNGETDVIVTATDIDGLSADDTIHVTVNAVNDRPNFALIQMDSVLTISLAELSTGSLDIAWEEAVDVDGDSIIYHYTSVLTVGTVTEQIDTSLVDTSFTFMSYQSLYDQLYALESTTAELEWNVYADDGHVSVSAENGPLTLSIDVSSLSIEDEAIPDVFALHQNYPNPFNPVTNIRFDVPEQSLVKMEIFNILGQRVKTLANQEMNAGFHSIQWNGSNDHGKPLSSGMYIYTINAGKFHAVKKLVFMK